MAADAGSAASFVFDRFWPGAAARCVRPNPMRLVASHKRFLDLLNSGPYEGLRIVRSGKECCLIVKADGEEHCFANRDGERANYHHAWQIRDWLEKQFGIPAAAVPVTKL